MPSSRSNPPSPSGKPLPPPSCLRCTVVMESGFVVDAGYLHVGQSRWVPGSAGAASPDVISEVSSAQLQQFRRVVAYRCPRCGYLESYAPDRA